MLKAVYVYVDDHHSKGKGVVSRGVTNHLREKFDVRLHRTTIGRKMGELGLVWNPIKAPPRTYASHRIHTIREFLIDLDKYVKEMRSGGGEYMFVFIDESYVNTNHACSHSYLPTDKKVDGKIYHKSSKDHTSIILHGITEEGPLTESVD